MHKNVFTAAHASVGEVPLYQYEKVTSVGSPIKSSSKNRQVESQVEALPDDFIGSTKSSGTTSGRLSGTKKSSSRPSGRKIIKFARSLFGMGLPRGGESRSL